MSKKVNKNMTHFAETMLSSLHKISIFDHLLFFHSLIIVEVSQTGKQNYHRSTSFLVRSYWKFSRIELQTWEFKEIPKFYNLFYHENPLKILNYTFYLNLIACAVQELLKFYLVVCDVTEWALPYVVSGIIAIIRKSLVTWSSFFGNAFLFLLRSI